MAALSRHSVLVTQPLSDAARRRLELFFEVQGLWTDREPTREELAASLQGKAGVLADSRFAFDAALIARAPQLRAVCHTGPGPHAIDLAACTRAGIRATSLPAQAATQVQDAASAQRVWDCVLPMLQRAAPAAAAQGGYGRWSRPRGITAATGSTLALLGDASWVPALARLAADARVRLLHANGAAEAAHADVLLLCAGSQSVDAAGRGDAPTVDAAALLAGPLQTEAPDATHMAVEDLVAALGFGRNGWHPANLLNPEILCESCC